MADAEKVERARTVPLTEEVRKGGVSVNPVVAGWLAGPMDNPHVTLDPNSSQNVAPQIASDHTPAADGAAPQSPNSEP